MLERISNFKAQAPVAPREQLPVGAYPAVIKAVELKEFSSGKKLRFSFDIAEGEYKDFYADDYKNNTYPDRKWRGIFDLWLPKNDGSERDGWTISAMERVIGAIEVSNPGFHFDWDERKLKGLKVGINMRNEEWSNGEHGGWTVRCGQFVSYLDALDGKVRPLKDKPLKNGSGSYGTVSSAASSFTEMTDDESELPF